jgi:hypothetical protein
MRKEVGTANFYVPLQILWLTVICALESLATFVINSR